MWVGRQRGYRAWYGMDCYALTTKTPILYFHNLSLDLFPSGLVWLQICYAEVQSLMIDGYLAFQKVRYLF